MTLPNNGLTLGAFPFRTAVDMPCNYRCDASGRSIYILKPISVSTKLPSPFSGYWLRNVFFFFGEPVHKKCSTASGTKALLTIIRCRICYYFSGRLKYRYFSFLVAVCTKVMRFHIRVRYCLKPIYRRTGLHRVNFVLRRLQSKHLDLSIFLSELHGDLFLRVVQAREFCIKHL